MSLADFLLLLLPNLDRALVGDAISRRIVSVARELPACAHGGFECRLAPDDDRVDLQVNLKPVHPPWLAGSRADPFWSRFEAFLADWMFDGSQAHLQISSLWLEFDLDVAETGLPMPSVFFTWQNDTRTAGQIAPLVSFLAGQAIGEQAARAAQGLMLALPSTARLSHLGVMFSRPDAPLRLNVEGLDRASVVPFLRTAGWPGDEAGLLSMLDEFAPACPSVIMAFDAGTDGLEGSIGLECHPERDSRAPSAWAVPLLEQLCRRALCTRGKAEGVAHWRGVTWRARHRGAWPSELEWPDRFFASSSESAFLRYLNHIKLTLRHDHRVLAKAYLAWEHRWPERSAVRALMHRIDPGHREE